MKSLELVSIDTTAIPFKGKTCCMCLDSLSEQAFFSTSNEVFAFSLQEKQVKASVKVDGGCILSMEYIMDNEAVSIATSAGDLLDWKPADGSLECVGTMESGITCLEWSPDQELFALTTGDEKCVLMTRDLDPIFEAELNPKEFGKAQPITVGWGKKETQFHGTEGKPTAADLKPKIAGPILPWDDKKVRISWREDGQFFAISSVDPVTGSRKIRIRSEEGNLQSTSEVIPGLEDSLDWRPCGNLIASSQRKPNKHDIIFFETNGLKHGEFSLPFKPKETKIIDLCWNKTSDVLAIWLEELNHDENAPVANPLSYLQLWSRNNYHWYLKQEYRFSSIGRRICGMLWDSDSPLKLHVLCAEGFYYQLSWRWTVLQSKESFVAVIDGANLLLTPFATAVVPPPMSLMKATFQAPVNHVCFGKCPSEATVILADGSAQQLTISVTDLEEKIDAQTVDIIRSDAISDKLEANPLGFLHLTSWIDNSYLSIYKTKTGQEALCYATPETDDPSKIFLRKLFPVDLKVLTIAVGKDSTCIAIEMYDGSVYSCEKDMDDTSISVKAWITPFGLPLRFPFPCETIAVCKVNHEDIVIGMTNHYRLYVNEKQIADNCTSFAIHDEYLVYTTHTHLLRCLRLDSLLKFVNSGGKEQLQNEDFSRSLERGSKIVSAVCNDTKVVLQMPRGNLETIHPRALVISFLKKQLDKLLYKDALTLMKRHRINLNLIYDHNPKLFLENVDTFITNVRSENDINLFLADLEKDDVTLSLYRTCYHRVSGNMTQYPDKVNEICSAVRKAIETIGSRSFFLSLLTSYAKQKEPDLETVLKLIKALKDQKTEATVTYEKALKHILYLTDVNELFDVALGLYDFEIVLMIAEKSNKDPKEYLPFLNELKKCEPNYSKFKIDCHLKRYKKALVNIYACGESHLEECLDFIVAHDLYKEALTLCQKEAGHFKRVSVLYGAYLLKKRVYNEAGIVFSRVGCHEEAKGAFIKSHNWKLAIAEAEKLQYTQDELVHFARTLADKLKELKNWRDAGNILELYTEDYESSISAYINGNLWQDSLRLIYRKRRLDIIETNLKPSLLETYHHNLELIQTSKTNFIKYKERLSVVRSLKERQLQEISDGLKEEVENDLFSEASSVTGQSEISASSKGSRASGHSSKSRRKYQRKKYSLKEGSRFEDFALVEALAEIVNTTDHLQDGVASLLEMLYLHSFENEASNLQNIFEDLLLFIKGSMKEIWSYSLLEDKAQLVTGPQSTANSIIADMQAKTQPEADNLAKGLPEPTKPILRENFMWKLQELLKN